MNKYTAIIAAAAAICLVGTAVAQTKVLIEGFEGPTGLVLNYSTGSQSSNSGIPRGPSDSLDASKVIYLKSDRKTQGEYSSYIANTFAIPGVATLGDQYERGAAASLHWSIRCHWAAGTTINKTAFKGLEIDVFNNATYPVDAAIMLNDGAYKRAPWKAIQPGVWTTLTWDFVADDDNLGPAVTSNIFAPLNKSADWKFYGVAVHTLTEPATADFSMYIDNLVGVATQSDTTPPSAPKLLKVEQGTVAGKLKVTWGASVDVDTPPISKYTVKVLPRTAFGSALANRMNFSVFTATEFPGTALTGEVDVPTGEPVYVFMTAHDSATPNANESVYEMPLGAVLAADGSVPQDLVVFDMKRLDMSDVTYGYQSMPAYFAKTWTTNARTFVSAKALAVENGSQVLTFKPTGFTYWCTGIDGNTAATAISDASCTKLAAYVAANGKLMIGGAQYLNALTAVAATPTQLAFVADTLKISAAAAVSTNRQFIQGVDYWTGAGPFYSGAGSTTAHYAVTPAAGATAIGEFKDVDGTVSLGDLGLTYGNKVVAMGVGFEQLRDKLTTTDVAADLPGGDAARAQVMVALSNLLFPANVSDWSQF